MIEGIANYATSVSQAKVASDASVSVARKVLDQTKLEGQATVSLIQSSGQVAAPTGDHTGAHVNVNA